MKLRLLLWPFSILYGFLISVRNFLYDSGLFKSSGFEVPVILVGNLSVGGTGKTPHTEYLIRLLSDNFRVATLSRGYGRNTKGFMIAASDSTAQSIGDEPMQYHSAFPDITVCVCEDRIYGIGSLLKRYPAPQIILMDDGYQHRAVTPSFSILLTPADAPFMNDHLLPAGNLREPRSGYWRSDCIIVTRCHPEISDAEQEKFISQIRPLPHQHVFFSSIEYGVPVAFADSSNKWIAGKQVCLFTGIANSSALTTYLTDHYQLMVHLTFNDHHEFNEPDIERILTAYKNYGCDMLLTTEKDYMRLKSSGLISRFDELPAYYIPITVRIRESEKFNNLILEHVTTFDAIEG